MGNNSEVQFFDESGYLNPETIATAAQDRASPVMAAVTAEEKPVKRKPGRPKKGGAVSPVAAEAKPTRGRKKAAAAATPKGPLWRVSLDCPTPIEHRTLDVEAGSQDEAKAKFCKANGISDSEHQFSYARIA